MVYIILLVREKKAVLFPHELLPKMYIHHLLLTTIKFSYRFSSDIVDTLEVSCIPTTKLERKCRGKRDSNLIQNVAPDWQLAVQTMPEDACVKISRIDLERSMF